jgi:hypothetical protein
LLSPLWPLQLLPLLQTRAELDAAEASVSALTAEKAALQQELSSSRDKVMLLESELKLKTSRMEAAQQQLASEGQEHQAKQALLHKQLEQLKVRGMCCVCLVQHGLKCCRCSTGKLLQLKGVAAASLVPGRAAQGRPEVSVDWLCWWIRVGFAAAMCPTGSARHTAHVAKTHTSSPGSSHCMQAGAHVSPQCVFVFCALLQADRDEARNQHAAAVTELEALSQQLAAASTGKSQAEAAAEELQAAHDALTAQQAALQAQVWKPHTDQRTAVAVWLCHSSQDAGLKYAARLTVAGKVCDSSKTDNTGCTMSSGSLHIQGRGCL